MTTRSGVGRYVGVEHEGEGEIAFDPQLDRDVLLERSDAVDAAGGCPRYGARAGRWPRWLALGTYAHAQGLVSADDLTQRVTQWLDAHANPSAR